MSLAKRPRAILATLAAAFLWGTSFPANQAGLASMSPGTFVAARFLLAALIILPFAWRLLPGALGRWEPWALGTVNAAGFYLQYVGQEAAPAGAASLLINANVVVVGLLAWAFLGERAPRLTWAALILALAGAALISYAPAGGAFEVRYLVVLLAGTIGSVYIVGSRGGLARGLSPLAIAASTFFVSALLLAPFLFLELPPLAPGPLALVAYTAAACSVAAYLLWLYGLPEMGATASAILLLFEVAVAAMLGAALFEESFSARTLAGAALILAGVLLVARGSPHPTSR